MDQRIWHHQSQGLASSLIRSYNEQVLPVGVPAASSSGGTRWYCIRSRTTNWWMGNGWKSSFRWSVICLLLGVPFKRCRGRTRSAVPELDSPERRPGDDVGAHEWYLCRRDRNGQCGRRPVGREHSRPDSGARLPKCECVHARAAGWSVYPGRLELLDVRHELSRSRCAEHSS